MVLFVFFTYLDIVFLNTIAAKHSASAVRIATPAGSMVMQRRECADRDEYLAVGAEGRFEVETILVGE